MNHHRLFTLIAAALTGGMLLISTTETQAQEAAPSVRGGIPFPFNPQRGVRFPKPTAPESRVPAMQRIDAGLTVNPNEEPRSVVRHDEVTTNVMSLHVVIGEPGIRAGHGFAPNVNRITKRQ